MVPRERPARAARVRGTISSSRSWTWTALGTLYHGHLVGLLFAEAGSLCLGASGPCCAGSLVRVPSARAWHELASARGAPARATLAPACGRGPRA